MGKFIRLLLAALFVYLIITVAAFRYLEWWQAILTSGFTFLLMVYGAKALIRYTIRRITGGLEFGRGLEGFATSMFRTKSRVLRNATVDVHSVRPIPAPPENGETDDTDENGEPPAELNWYAFDVSIFPARRSQSPMSHWDLDDLLLVPFDAEVTENMESLGSSEEFGLHDLRLVGDGEEVTPDESKFHGPRRLRFVAGVSKPVREVKFRYYFEAFGHIRLPDPLTTPRIASADG